MPFDHCKENWGKRANLLFRTGFRTGLQLLTQSESKQFGGIHTNTELAIKAPGKLIRQTVLEVKSCNTKFQDTNDGTVSLKFHCQDKLVPGLYASIEAMHNADRRQSVGTINLELEEDISQFHFESVFTPDKLLSNTLYAGMRYGGLFFGCKIKEDVHMSPFALDAVVKDEVSIIARFCSKNFEVNACRDHNGCLNASMYWKSSEESEIGTTIDSVGDGFDFATLKYGFATKFSIGSHTYCRLKFNNDKEAGVSFERKEVLPGVSIALSALYDGKKASILEAVKLGLCLNIDPSNSED